MENEAMTIGLEAIASRLEAMTIGLEAIASRFDAGHRRLEAIAIRLEAIAIGLEASLLENISCRPSESKIKKAPAMREQRKRLLGPCAPLLFLG